jgi:hypothetical protein
MTRQQFDQAIASDVVLWDQTKSDPDYLDPFSNFSYNASAMLRYAQSLNEHESRVFESALSKMRVNRARAAAKHLFNALTQVIESRRAD